MAVEHYLARKRRGLIEAQIADAYGGQADTMLAEAAGLMDAQAWPDE
jgi:hypothetical protein